MPEKRMPWPSATEALTLRLLVGRGESYGLQLVKASDGELKRGSVYVVLGRLEEKGFVESRQEDETPEYIGIPRRLYKITGVGSRALNAYEMGRAMLAGLVTT